MSESTNTALTNTINSNNNNFKNEKGEFSITPPSTYDFAITEFDKNTYVQISTLNNTGINIRLPLPSQLDYNSSFNWSTEELGAFVGAMMKSVFNDNASIDTLKPEQITNTPDIWSVLGNQGAEIMKKFAGTFVSQFLTGNEVAMKEYLKNYKQGGPQSYNPNEQLYFNGVSHREFQLVFELAPLSQQHANTIFKGIKDLRIAASPELSADAVYFTYPSYFKMSVIVNNNEVFTRPSFAIKDITTNFSPNGVMSYHADGKPVNFTLELQCIETTIPTKKTEQSAVFFGA